jgi:hypothetical protein
VAIKFHPPPRSADTVAKNNKELPPIFGKAKVREFGIEKNY